MNKKFLIAIIVILAVVLAAGFFTYKYLNQIKDTGTENFLGGANIENPADQTEIPQAQIEADGIQVEGSNAGGGLSICFDKCGDSICQKSDPDCRENSLNCICPETPQECPQDCK